MIDLSFSRKMQGSTSNYANKIKLNRAPLAELPRPEPETSIVDPEHIKEKLPSHEELLRSKNKVEGMFLISFSPV
jgi:hypothetical protein